MVDLETLIEEDGWPLEMANLAREIYAMAPGRARFDRLPELDEAAKRAGLSRDAFSRLMAWQATWPDVKIITNDPRAVEYGAQFADKPPLIGLKDDADE